MDTLLVYGYVREIEQSLTNHRIIPLDIYHICFDYYFTTKFIFYLVGTRDYESTDKENADIMCTANIDTKKTWKISIDELDDNKKRIRMKDAKEGEKWSMDCAGIGFAKNINLPNNIKQKLSILSDTKFKFNNIVFRCGGQNATGDATDYCAALIFDSHQFQKPENEVITAYNWSLPTLPELVYSNFVLYSNNTHELLSIAGESNEEFIYKLSFNDEQYLHQNLKEWKWNEMNTKIPTPRSCVCAAMIDNATKLIIIGGQTYIESAHSNKVELLNMDKNIWIDVKDRKDKVIDSGIYYDDPNALLFVGGGYSDKIDDATKCVESYDFTKNIWNQLPPTNHGHDMNPLLWIEDNNILHIMSIWGNCIEQIDLRESKQWNIINSDLSKLFNTTFNKEQGDATASRVVGN